VRSGITSLKKDYTENVETLDKAKLCLKIIKERKAIDPVLLAVGNLTSITDYFLIASGNSSRQVQAISRHLQKRTREAGFRPNGIEGEQEGHWVLLDYGDVIIHVFYNPFREFYDLEGLWIEAPRINHEIEN
jgi:ribosome-associated protein